MKFLIIFSCLIGLSFAETTIVDKCEKGNVGISLNLKTKEEASNSDKNVNYDEKRGCCSWHGGVCGCNYGRAQCCDGTTSPSCGC